jgi:hypothetical protein
MALLVALLGGVAMGALAGARRTESAYPNYLARTEASDLQVQVNTYDGSLIPRIDQAVARLPDVTGVGTAPYLLVLPLGRNGLAEPKAVNSDKVSVIGSEGVEYFADDRVAVVGGRMADPSRAAEIVATPEAAQLSGWHLGQTIRFGAFTYAQANSSTFNELTARPPVRFSAKLVGLVAFANKVVDDDVDRYPQFILMTPALTRQLSQSQVYPEVALRLAHGPRDVSAVEREVISALPRGTTYEFAVTAINETSVQRAVRPEVIAIGVFGLITALATLIIGAQAIARRLSAEEDELRVLAALGAGVRSRALSAVLGVLIALAVGGIVAAGLAILMSPLAPVGPVRQVDAHPGFHADWAVLLAGLAVFVLGLGLFAYVLAQFRARQLRRGAEEVPVRSGMVETAAQAGLPVPALVGLRFALERGTARSAAPVRSALFGSALAIVVVVATVTFGSGLSSLDSHPALYGWNWTYGIDSPSGQTLPPTAVQLLASNKYVAAVAGFNFAALQIDGQAVPTLLEPSAAHSSLPVSLVSGHGVEGRNQIVLGKVTMAALGKRLGQTVTVTYGSPQNSPVYAHKKMVIVGAATLPSVGTPVSLHSSMGVGAVISKQIETPGIQRVLTGGDPNLEGPNLEVVRMRAGVPMAAAARSLRSVVAKADAVMVADPQGQGSTYQVIGAQRPAEIVEYQSTGATPLILAGGLAAGAAVALGLALTASVRRRRRDLAVIKVLGFTRRQLGLAVVSQASTAAVIGIVVGVPLGIVLGRWLWDSFAGAIDAVPLPSVPFGAIALVAVVALLLANVVAAVPGRLAARTTTALALRSE